MLLTGGNPVAAATGQLTLFAGCDYKAADGNAAVFVNAAGTWPNLTGAKVYLVGYAGQQPIPTVVVPGVLINTVNTWFPAPLLGPILGAVLTPTGNQQISFDITATQTSIRPTTTPTDLYGYAITAQLPNGDVVPLQAGSLQIMGVGSL